MIGTFWYSPVSRNTVCHYCWQWRAKTKPEEHTFLKPYCSSQSGPGNLGSCILKDCQDELCYTNMSVLDSERRASVPSRSSKKVLLFFPQEFPISDFTFHIPHIPYWNFKKEQNPQNPTKQKTPPNQMKPKPPKALIWKGRDFYPIFLQFLWQELAGRTHS